MYEAYLSEASDLDMGLGRNVLSADQETKLSQAANRSQIGTSRQGSAGGNSGLSNIPPPKPAIPKVKYPVAGTPPTKPNTTTAAALQNPLLLLLRLK
jgi:hypothetical protein